MNRTPTFVYQSQHANLFFDHPVEVFTAHALDEVCPALEAADACVARGQTAVGFIAYEAAPAFDPSLACHAPGEFPLAWITVFDDAQETDLETCGTFTLSEWRAAISQSDYDLALNAIRKWIGAGDTYQVNYTYPLDAAFDGDPYAAYCALRNAQGHGYTAYADTGRFQVVSASPELFFHLEGGVITSRPMKGTRARGLWCSQDDALARELRESDKDRAENVMIVDMIRNDLGRIAEWGSVSVEELFAVEQYPTVWQMTSTVRARTNRSVPEIIAAMFPCASVTGAPKVQTMRRIRELEPETRGAYCGAMGWWGPGGNAEFNVAIRTMTIDNERKTARYHVGSGITWDSDPQDEFDECGAKTAILHHAEPEFELLESLLFDGAYFLLREHLERLEASARYFGFEMDAEGVRAQIVACAGQWVGAPHKIRVLLNRMGGVRIEGEAIPATIRPRVGIAGTRVDRGDRFLYHKTTHRDMYDRALASRPDCGDVFLINDNGELTESTRANIVIQLGDALYTPPVECGLLAGVMRNHLLQERRIEERVLYPSDLENAGGIWLINSVRKWIDVEYAPIRRDEPAQQSAPADAP